MTRGTQRPLPLQAVQQHRDAAKPFPDPAPRSVADIGEQQVLRSGKHPAEQARRHERPGGSRDHQLCGDGHAQAAPAQAQSLGLDADKTIDRAIALGVDKRGKFLVVPGILKDRAIEVRVESCGRMVPVSQECGAKEFQNPGNILALERPNQVHAPCLCAPRSAARSCLPLGSRGKASRTSNRAGCMCRGNSVPA